MSKASLDTSKIARIVAANVAALTNRAIGSDHDSLTILINSVSNLDAKFTEKFADLKTDIAKLGDGTAVQLADHEIRLKKHTTDIEIMQTQLKTWLIAISAAFALAQFVVFIYKK